MGYRSNLECVGAASDRQPIERGVKRNCGDIDGKWNLPLESQVREHKRRRRRLAQVWAVGDGRRASNGVERANPLPQLAATNIRARLLHQRGKKLFARLSLRPLSIGSRLFGLFTPGLF